MTGYVVVVEGNEADGFSAWSPDLPGCAVAADTYDGCAALMREAIPGHLDVMREYGDPVPEPSAAGSFTVAA
jgi:predicted RNase H-like HicB family nuclease